MTDKEKELQAEAIGYLRNRISELEKENAELKGLKDVATLIRANNDTVTTLMQLNNMLVSKNQQLEKTKSLNEEIIKALKGSWDCEWLPAHNGKAKYLYLQTVIDIVNEKFEEIKEK